MINEFSTNEFENYNPITNVAPVVAPHIKAALIEMIAIMESSLCDVPIDNFTLSQKEETFLTWFRKQTEEIQRFVAWLGEVSREDSPFDITPKYIN